MNTLVNSLKIKYNLSEEIISILKKYDRKKFHPVKNNSIYYNRPKLIPNTQQTMSAPHIHAMALQIMFPFVKSELLKVKNDYRKLKFNMLDVGCGTGYVSALMAEMIQIKKNKSKLVCIDVDDYLVKLTKKNLQNNGFLFEIQSDKIIVKNINGWEGFVLNSPYMFIHVGASANELPIELYNQLAVNGALLIPINNDYVLIEKIKKDGKIVMKKKILANVRFVKLIKNKK